MRHRHVIVPSICLLWIVGLSGCTPSTQTTSNVHGTNSVAPSTNYAGASTKEAQDASRRDGDVISFTKINDTSNGTTFYEMFYESAGYKIDAYLEVPQKPGTYPMLVACHGGWTIPRPDLSHDTQDAFGLKYIHAHQPNAVYLYPQYRGYENSDGTVQDTASVVRDIENGIVAASGATKSTIDGLYLYGISMGGDAALLVASERRDVKAVVVDSPFLGLDSFMEWYQKLGQPKDLQPYYKTYVYFYGSDVHSKAYKEVSASEHSTSITAPVMVIEGTKDFFLWQPKKEFVDKLKEQGKIAKYIEIPGGHHGQTFFVYSLQAQEALNGWYQQYGFPDDVL